MGLRWLLSTLVLSCACRLDAFDAVSRGAEPRADGGGAKGPTYGDYGEARTDGSVDARVDATGPGCGDTETDVANCGACGARCEASPHAAIACIDARCIESRVALVGARPGPLHGGDIGGGAFRVSQLCDADEVVRGIRGMADLAAYGLGVHCGRISRADGTVHVVPTNSKEPVGGAVGGQQPYELLCPEGAVVTGIAGTTWLFPNATALSIGRLSLTCSRVLLDRGELVLAELAEPLVAGHGDNASSQPFDDACGMNGVVVGFSGRSGAYIDALAVHCAAVLTMDAPIEPTLPVTERNPSH